ncbi:hypothetical protein DERF_000849 [Dermatophagoides farinae]|uniref:Uncharacterized protein n=1 Tax=Dermatophagoides farinae TaxID=6954 RepID=A0A922I9L3_DERFA|nr:hypothetical protein DERF_000849 [Dermatophagoides farinae]
MLTRPLSSLISILRISGFTFMITLHKCVHFRREILRFPGYIVQSAPVSFLPGKPHSGLSYAPLVGGGRSHCI